METKMNPNTLLQQAVWRHESLIAEARHERHLRQLRREMRRKHSTVTRLNWLDAALVQALNVIGDRLIELGRAMQISRRQSA